VPPLAPDRWLGSVQIVRGPSAEWDRSNAYRASRRPACSDQAILPSSDEPKSNRETGSALLLVGSIDWRTSFSSWGNEPISRDRAEVTYRVSQGPQVAREEHHLRPYEPNSGLAAGSRSISAPAGTKFPWGKSSSDHRSGLAHCGRPPRRSDCGSGAEPLEPLFTILGPNAIASIFSENYPPRVCVGYLGGKRDWIPRSPALRGNEESSPRKRRTRRSSRQAAGGCGATGGPRCHGWQRGPGTQPLVVQGFIGPRKARGHVATHFKAGNEGQTDQDRQRQSNALAQADSQSTARARMGRAPSLPRSAGERGTYPRKRRTPIHEGHEGTRRKTERKKAITPGCPALLRRPRRSGGNRGPGNDTSSGCGQSPTGGAAWHEGR
jgi:hypothetical protein